MIRATDHAASREPSFQVGRKARGELRNKLSICGCLSKRLPTPSRSGHKAGVEPGTARQAQTDCGGTPAFGRAFVCHGPRAASSLHSPNSASFSLVQPECFTRGHLRRMRFTGEVNDTNTLIYKGKITAIGAVAHCKTSAQGWTGPVQKSYLTYFFTPRFFARRGVTGRDYRRETIPDALVLTINAP